MWCSPSPRRAMNRPTGESGESKTCRQFGTHRPGTIEPIAYAFVLVVDRAQYPRFVRDPLQTRAKRKDACRSEFVLSAPGHDGIQQITLAERLLTGAQELFLQP